MKKHLFFYIASMGLSLTANAQTFTSIGTDTQSDHGFGLDAKELFYATNTTEDTLFVKIETFNARTGDFGFAIAIDTNLNPMDGMMHPQQSMSSNPNTSMSFDVMVFAYQNGFFPGVWIDLVDSLGAVPLNNSITIDTVDLFNCIFTIPVADIGGDLEVNLVAFTGSFDIGPGGAGPRDAMPNATFSQVRKSNINIVENTMNSIKAYPNPAKGFIHVEGQFKQLSVLDMSGKSIKTFEPSIDQRYDISELSQGFYFIQADQGLPIRIKVN